MNCYDHQDVPAVATCACGRGLCAGCQNKRHPPQCDVCHAAAVVALRSKTRTRLAVNCVMAFAYLGILMSGGQSGANQFLLLMALAWGFFGFRWLLDGLLGATRLAVFATAQTWWVFYFVGSLLCALTGFIVVPIEIVLQLRTLKRLKAEGVSPAGVGITSSAVS